MQTFRLHQKKFISNAKTLGPTIGPKLLDHTDRVKRAGVSKNQGKIVLEVADFLLRGMQNVRAVRL
jgi:hypothetical protein